MLGRRFRRRTRSVHVGRRFGVGGGQFLTWLVGISGGYARGHAQHPLHHSPPARRRHRGGAQPRPRWPRRRRRPPPSRRAIPTPPSWSASSSNPATSTSSTLRAPPLDQVLLDNIYETLVKATPGGEISPGLATLDISEDGLTYTLTLQEGVTFHDGDPLTASDVVWTLEQQRAEGSNEAATLASIESVEATDDLTVVLTLSEPDNDLAFNLSRRAGAVLNEGATDLETTANGTGPFTLGEWSQGSFISLAAQRRLLGRPGEGRRGRVPVLHRSQRRASTPSSTATPTSSPASTPSSSASSRTTPTTWSRPTRRTASSRSGSTTPTRRCPTSVCARRSPRRSTSKASSTSTTATAR